MFSYLKWSVRNPGERYRTEWRHPEPHTTGLICPEPDCLRERKGLERTGEYGEVTLIALPCSQHTEIFWFQENWPEGWYERFAEAFYAKQPAQEPMTCEQWGHRYTSYLWGHARDWHAAGGDPNGTRNLEDEHDRLYAAGELPVLGRRPPGYTGWASGSDNGGSSCHHDAAMLNAPPMMFNASRCSFVSSTSPDCTRASPASSTFNVSIIALTPEFSTIWLNISRMGISRSISVVIPHTPRPLLRPPRGPFWAEIRKVHAFRLFRVWILRQPPPHRGGPEI